MASRTIDARLQEEFAGMSASEAVDLLCTEFDAGDTNITFLKTGNRSEIRAFLTATYLDALLASDIGPIEFWGGPPKNRKYFSGSLLTYLFDQILFSWVLHGHYSELVQGKED
jgi:hypothetical protein